MAASLKSFRIRAVWISCPARSTDQFEALPRMKTMETTGNSRVYRIKSRAKVYSERPSAVGGRVLENSIIVARNCVTR